MEKGDDELAKEALKRRKSNQENADTMKSQLDQQRKAVDQLISNTKCAPCLLLCEACMPSAAVIPALEWSYESLFCFVPQLPACIHVRSLVAGGSQAGSDTWAACRWAVTYEEHSMGFSNP